MRSCKFCIVPRSLPFVEVSVGINVSRFGHGGMTIRRWYDVVLDKA